VAGPIGTQEVAPGSTANIPRRSRSLDSSLTQERDAALEDAWAAVSEAQENILAMERGLMEKFGRFLEPEHTETIPVEPSTSKGKNIDPRNWGDVDLDEEEIDQETQQALLEEAAANNHNNEFDDVHIERLRLERVRQEIQNIYDKHKKSSKRDKRNRKPRDTTPLSKDMEKLIEDASGGRHAPTEPSESPQKGRRGDKTPVLRASNQIAPDSYLGDILGRGKKSLTKRQARYGDDDSEDSSDDDSSDSDSSSPDSSDASDSESEDSRDGRRHRRKRRWRRLQVTEAATTGSSCDRCPPVG